MDKTCSTCGHTKPSAIEFFQSTGPGKLAARCRTCDSAKAKEWYAANRDRARAKVAEWRKANPEKLSVYAKAEKAGVPVRNGYKLKTEPKARSRRASEMRRESKRRYYASSAKYRLIHRIRNRTLKALNGEIKLGLTRTWIGCTPAELMAHLEAQFQPGMSWDNRGAWHVDHIRPLASFDLTDQQQRRAACHFTNLQPLWAEENIAKGARLDWAA